MSFDNALNRALDRLAAAKGLDAASSDAGSRAVPSALSADERAMYEVGRRLVEGREAFVGDPRPSFVLDLEDELRADLRTGLASPVVESTRRRTVLRSLAVGLAVAGTLMGAVLLAQDTTVGHPLYPVKRLGEQVQLWFARGPVERAEILCDLAWHRLDELQRLVGTPRRGDDAVADTVHGVVAGYGEALRISGGIGDDLRPLWTARSGASFAADALELLQRDARLTPEEQDEIATARLALHVRLLDSSVANPPPNEERGGVGSVAVPPRATATTGSASAATAVAGAPPGEPLPGQPGEAPRRPTIGAAITEIAPPTPTSTVLPTTGPTVTVIPQPSSSPTGVPTAVPTLVPTEVPDDPPPARPPSRPTPTATTPPPAPTEPVPTVNVPVPTATDKVPPTSIAPPTPTVDPLPPVDPWPTPTPASIGPMPTPPMDPSPPPNPTASPGLDDPPASGGEPNPQP